VVQILRNGGQDAKIEPRGITGWVFTLGGYRVTLEYHIETPYVACDLEINLLSTESRRGGRQWLVLSPTKAVKDGSLVPTPLALTLGKIRSRGTLPFLTNWTRKLHRREAMMAYMDTRPAEDRPLLAERCAGQMALTVCAAYLSPGATSLLADPERFLPGFSKFAAGEFVTIDPREFYSGVQSLPADDPDVLAKLREAVMKRFFYPGGPYPETGLERGGDRPNVSEGGHVRLEHNGRIFLAEFMLEGAFVLEADGKLDANDPQLERDIDPARWRVVGFRVDRIRGQMPTGTQIETPIPPQLPN
jgi:hypothetical protein